MTKLINNSSPFQNITETILQNNNKSIPEYPFHSTISSSSNNSDNILSTKPGTYNFNKRSSVFRFHTRGVLSVFVVFFYWVWFSFCCNILPGFDLRFFNNIYYFSELTISTCLPINYLFLLYISDIAIIQKVERTLLPYQK